MNKKCLYCGKIHLLSNGVNKGYCDRMLALGRKKKKIGDGPDTSKRLYDRAHKWAERQLIKTGQCQACGLLGKTEWSNTDHKYSCVSADWRELCRPCHVLYDSVNFGKLLGRGRTGRAAVG